jgi:SAM-dependent methyltransferase
VHKTINSTRKNMTITAFAKKAADYAAHRPPYAPDSIETLCDAVALQPSWVVADVGCGTGNVARHLVGRAARVYGIEPDDAMRGQAEALLGMHARFKAIAATAEVTTLPDRRVDLITVGQALHWFDPAQAWREFDRILRPDGWLALVWNRFGPEREMELSPFLRSEECRRFSFGVTLWEDWPGFIGGMRSAAHTPNKGERGYAEFERMQRAAFAARAVNGILTTAYRTELVVGRLRRKAECSVS